MVKKRKAKAKKEPFWKNLNPELKHIGDHIGKIMDNAKPSDVLDMIAALTAAYAGFRAGQMANVDILSSLGLAGSGVLAYQLAKSPNVVAGGSGVVYLASLGLINVFNPLVEAAAAAIPVKKLEDALRAARGLAPLPKGTRIDIGVIGGVGGVGFGFP